MHLSTLIWKAIFSRWWLTQKHTTTQGAENEKVQNARLQRDYIWGTPPPSCPRDHFRKGHRKNRKSQRQWMRVMHIHSVQQDCSTADDYKKALFSLHSYTHELIAVVMAHTRAVPDQIPAWRWELSKISHPYPWGYWQLLDARKGKDDFLQECSHTSVGDQHSDLFGQEKLSWWFEKRMKRGGWGRWWG